MTNPAYILEGTVDNFDHLVLENSKRGLVLVDFWAPWVGPSLKQREILIELAERYKGRFLLVSVNTDDQKPLAERFGVRSLPSFKLFRQGELVAEYHGVQPEADYPRIVESYVEKPLDET
ncbi:MAG: thioredoxin, partial [Candidatus Thiodiazotropha sp. (ex Notomyrtea botanica)]|nr:thioredoxin [Candidatus Thiodiazotropha sp. (ex Notomyrtea botanica)]